MSLAVAQEVEVRASALLDMPPVRDRYEHKAYVRGYAMACLTYVKRNGIPFADDLRTLSEATRAAEWDRHPAAHKKGMAELRKHLRRYPEPMKGA